MGIDFKAKLTAQNFNDAFMCRNEDTDTTGRIKSKYNCTSKRTEAAAATIDLAVDAGVVEITGSGASDITSFTGTIEDGQEFTIINSSDSVVTVSAVTGKAVEIGIGCMLNLTGCSGNLIPESGAVGATPETPNKFVDGATNTDDAVYTGAGSVGIGTADPTNQLHLSGGTDPLRVEGLQLDNTLDEILVKDANGVFKCREVTSLPTGGTGGISASTENEFTAPQCFDAGLALVGPMGYRSVSNTNFQGDSYATPFAVVMTLSSFAVTKFTNVNGTNVVVDGFSGGRGFSSACGDTIDAIHTIINVSAVKLTIRNQSPKTGSFDGLRSPSGSDLVIEPGGSVQILFNRNNSNFWHAISETHVADQFTDRFASTADVNIASGQIINSTSPLWNSPSSPNNFTGNDMFENLNSNVNYELRIWNPCWLGVNAPGATFDTLEFQLSATRTNGIPEATRTIKVTTDPAHAHSYEIVIPIQWGAPFANPGTGLNLSIGGLANTELVFGGGTEIRLVQRNDLCNTVRFE